MPRLPTASLGHAPARALVVAAKAETASHGSSVSHGDAPAARGRRTRSRRAEGPDVHLDPGRGGLLSHAQHLLGGGRVEMSAHTDHIIACGSAQHKTAGVRLDLRVRLWFFSAGEGVAYILGMS